MNLDNHKKKEKQTMEKKQEYKTFEVGYSLYVDYSDETATIDRRDTIEMTALTAEEAYNDAEALWESNDMAFFGDDDETGGISLLEIDIDCPEDIKEV